MDALFFKVWDAEASKCLAQKSILAGQQSTFKAGEGIFTENTFQVSLNQIHGTNRLGLHDNQSTGSFIARSQGELNLTHNEFSSGDFLLENITGNTSLHENKIYDVKTSKIQAPQGRVNLNRNRTQAVEVMIESKELVMQDEEMSGKNAIQLHASEADMHTVIVDSSGTLNLTVDEGKAQQTKLFGREGVQIEAGEWLGEEVAIVADNQALNIVANTIDLTDAILQGKTTTQRAVHLSHKDVNCVAETVIDRESESMVIEGGRDQASIVIEKATTLIQDRHYTHTDQKIERTSKESTLLNSSLEAPQIALNSDQQFGRGNNFRAKTLKMNSENVHEVSGTFEVEGSTIVGDEVSLPLAEFSGSVVVEAHKSIDAPELSVDGNLMHLHAPHLSIPKAHIDVDDVHIEVEKVADLSNARLKAENSVLVKSNNLQAPNSQFQANKEVALQGERYVDLENAEIAAQVCDISGAHANLKDSRIKADTTIQNSSDVDLTGAIHQGVLEVNTQGIALISNFKMMGDSLRITGERISGGDVQAQAGSIQFSAERNISFPEAHLQVGSGGISLDSKYIDAQEMQAETSGEMKVISEELTDLRGSTTQSKSIAVQGSYIDLQNSHLIGSVDISNNGHANLNDAVIEGLLQVNNEEAVIANRLKSAGESVKIETTHFSLQNANVQTESRITLLSHGDASIRNTHLQTEGDVKIVSQHLDGSEVCAEANGQIKFLTEGIATLSRAKLIAGKDAQLEAAFLNIERAYIKAMKILERGWIELLAAKSRCSAQTVLEQFSRYIIDVKGSFLRAGWSIKQEADWINHQSATSMAKWNFIKAAVFDNQNGMINSTIEAEASYFLNQGGKLILEKGSSYIIALSILSSFQTEIMGRGDIKLLSSSPHREYSRINLDGAYQVEAPQIEIKSAASTKNISLKATQGNIVVDKGAPVAAQETAELDCVSLINNDRISAEALSIHQKVFRDPGSAEGSSLLMLSSATRIAINQPKTTKGSLYLKSAVGIDINQPIHVNGSGIFKTPGNVAFNRVQAVFKEGIQVKAHAFNLFSSALYITGDSSVECNIANLTFEKRDSLFNRWLYLGTHSQTPSYFHHKGNLYWKVHTTVIDGSHMHNVGNMHLEGRAFHIKSRMTIVSYEVPVGKVRSKNWMGKKKSKTLYETRHQIVVTALATLQVEQGKLFVDKSSINVDGGVLLAHEVEGVANAVFVGIRSSFGDSPTFLPHFPKASGLPDPKPGGSFQTNHNISLVLNDFHVNGFFESSFGKVKITAQRFLLEKRVVERETEVGKIGRFGRIRKRTVKIDTIQPGAFVRGAEGIDLAVGSGEVIGGTIASGGESVVTGGDWTQRAAIGRTVERLNPGKVSLFKKCAAYSQKRIFESAQFFGKKSLFNLNGRFTNIASHVIGLDEVSVTAAAISSLLIFDVYKSKTSRTWKGNQDIYSIDAMESSIRCINGPLSLDGTDGPIYIEGGELGSYKGHLLLRSTRSIFLMTRSMTADNRISSTSFSFPKVSYESHRFNTVTTAVAHVFAGDGMTINTPTLVTEGVSVDVIGDASIEAGYWHRYGHKVQRYHEMEGFSVGLKFFGSDAIGKVFERNKPKHIATSSLEEDPFLSSFCNLVRGPKDGVSVVKNAVTTAILGWNEISKFSKAYNNGQLGNSLGQHFGLTDANGKFNPKVGFVYSVSENAMDWTETRPSQFRIQGNYTENVKKVRDCGTQFLISGNDTTYNDELILDSEVDAFEKECSHMSVEVGHSSSGWYGSVGYAQSRGKRKMHIAPRRIVGGDLTLTVRRMVANGGAYYEGEHVHMTVDELSGETPTDTSKHRSLSFSASTDYQASFSMSRAKESQAPNVMTIKARQSGHIDARVVELKGGLIENITINPDAIVKLWDVKTTKNAFSISGKYYGKDNFSEDEKEGIKIWGDADFSLQSKKGKVRSTIAGGNGEIFGANTSLDRLNQTKRKHNLHLAAPAVTFNSDILAGEAQDISHTLGLSQPPLKLPAAKDDPKIKQSPEKRKVKLEETAFSKPAVEEPKKAESRKLVDEKTEQKDTQEFKLERTALKKAFQASNAQPKTRKKTSKTQFSVQNDPHEFRLEKTALRSTSQASNTEVRNESSFRESIINVSLELEGWNRRQTMFQAHIIAMPIDAMDYVTEYGLKKFKEMTDDISLIGRINKMLVHQVLLIPLGPLSTTYPMLKDKIVDLARVSGAADFVAKLYSDCQKSFLDLLNHTGVTDFVAKIRSEYESHIEKQVIVNRKFQIEDSKTRQYYDDLFKITTTAAFSGILGAGSKLIKRAPKSPPTQLARTETSLTPAIKDLAVRIDEILQFKMQPAQSLCHALLNAKEGMARLVPKLSHMENKLKPNSPASKTKNPLFTEDFKFSRSYSESIQKVQAVISKKEGGGFCLTPPTFIKSPYMSLIDNLPATIQKRTKLIPEHLGVSSEVFDGDLFGWVSLRRKTLKVKLENIFIKEGDLLYWKSAMNHLIKLAKHNNAKILHFEANFDNPKFERVMQKLYGPAKEEIRFSKSMGDESIWHIFKIPVNEKIKGSFLKPYSSHVQMTLDHISSSVTQNVKGASNYYESLGQAENKIAKFIPSVSHLGKNREQIMTAVMQEVKGWTDQIFEFHYFPINPAVYDSKNFVAKMSTPLGGFSAVVKSKFFFVIEEAVSLDILKSLKLRNLQTPEILAIRKNRGQYLLAKTYLKGKTFKTYIEDIGSCKLGTMERTIYLNEFAEGCYAMGKAIGELNSKGAQREYLKGALNAESTKWTLAYAEKNSAELNLTRLKTNIKYLEKLAQNLKKSVSETYAYLLPDVHSEQFVFIPGESVGLVDAEMFTLSMDASKKPIELAAKNLFNFLKIIDVEGLFKGLTLEEIHYLKEMYYKGFYSEFKGKLSDASLQFFEFDYKIRALGDLILGLKNGNTRNRAQVEEFIKQWNRDLSLQNENFSGVWNSGRVRTIVKIDAMNYVSGFGSKEIPEAPDESPDIYHNFSTPDGSIAPITNFLLFPLDSIGNLGKDMVLSACNSNSIMQRVCIQFQDFLPRKSLKKRALVLTANFDHNNAFNLGFFGSSTPTFKKIESMYDVKYRRISDVFSFCKAIDEETFSAGPIDLLIIRAHGNQIRIRLDTDRTFTIYDQLPSSSCLNNLSSESTILIDSCSTGKGEENENNFANYISMNSPPRARVFSATDVATGFAISQEDPIEFQFYKVLSEVLTYKIDPENKEKMQISL
jgi:hypothetical protein